MYQPPGVAVGHCVFAVFVGYIGYVYCDSGRPQLLCHSVRGLPVCEKGGTSVAAGLVAGYCGEGLLSILFKLGDSVSRGLEGGNDSVSEVPLREPGFDPCLRETNRVVPPRARDNASSSSSVTTFSEVSLGRRDFLDWYSSIAATALLTSLPRTGCIRELMRLPSDISVKNHIRGLSQLLDCGRHSRKAHRMIPN